MKKLIFFNIGEGVILESENITLEKTPTWGQIHAFKKEQLYFILCIGKQGSGLFVFNDKGKLFRSTQIPNKHIHHLQSHEIAELLFDISTIHYGELDDS